MDLLQGYRRKLEFFLVAIIVAVLFATAFERYAELAKEAKILRLRVISEHFLTAAINLRIESLLSKIPSLETTAQKGVMVDGKVLYVSDQGWPLSTSPLSHNYRPTDTDCYELWQILLQNPASITLGEFTQASADYRVFARGDVCRYAMTNDAYFFDYIPVTGKLLFSSPVKE